MMYNVNALYLMIFFLVIVAPYFTLAASALARPMVVPNITTAAAMRSVMSMTRFMITLIDF